MYFDNGGMKIVKLSNYPVAMLGRRPIRTFKIDRALAQISLFS